jgi:hypothetical protein
VGEEVDAVADVFVVDVELSDVDVLVLLSGVIMPAIAIIIYPTL